jgi:hypothetical protein
MVGNASRLIEPIDKINSYDYHACIGSNRDGNMKTNKTTKEEKKEKLLNQLKAIQEKLALIENQRSEKIIKLAKKYNLINLSDKIIKHEFELIQSKYEEQLKNTSDQDDSKKN